MGHDTIPDPEPRADWVVIPTATGSILGHQEPGTPLATLAIPRLT